MKKENNENFNTINTSGKANDGFIKRANDVMKAVQSADQANEDLVGIVLELQVKDQPARIDSKPNAQSVHLV